MYSTVGLRTCGVHHIKHIIFFVLAAVAGKPTKIVERGLGLTVGLGTPFANSHIKHIIFLVFAAVETTGHTK